MERNAVITLIEVIEASLFEAYMLAYFDAMRPDYINRMMIGLHTFNMLFSG